MKIDIIESNPRRYRSMEEFGRRAFDRSHSYFFCLSSGMCYEESVVNKNVGFSRIEEKRVQTGKPLKSRTLYRAGSYEHA
ncbi:hypothetical protein [Peribacillus sp. FSL R5-0717]|uniref:hypothetical protein n=1 Tax=Peribacillus sp. FSL R5-0717 TaxID=2975308 RepID=UPI0030F8436E